MRHQKPKREVVLREGTRIARRRKKFAEKQARQAASAPAPPRAKKPASARTRAYLKQPPPAGPPQPLYMPSNMKSKPSGQRPRRPRGKYHRPPGN